MSDTAFDKNQFQNTLRANLPGLLAGSEAVNRGQLESFLLYFSSANTNQYQSDTLLTKLDEDAFSRALKLVMIYATLAITIEETTVFNAALEVFPVDEVSPANAVFVIAVLDHVRDNPSEAREFFVQGQPATQLAERMAQLRMVLNGRFAETL